MQFDVVTLFPEMFTAITQSGITRRAFEQKKCALSLWNPRDFTSDKHRTVDDRPYGGGPGMVMMVKPLEAAVQAAKARQTEQGLAVPRVVYICPVEDGVTHCRAFTAPRSIQHTAYNKLLKNFSSTRVSNPASRALTIRSGRFLAVASSARSRRHFSIST